MGLKWLAPYLLGCMAVAASAQTVHSNGPDVYHKKRKPGVKAEVTLAPPSVFATLAPPPEAKLSALTDSEVPFRASKFGPEAVGAHRKLPAGLLQFVEQDRLKGSVLAGAWFDLPGGGRVWRMVIRSQAAFGLRVRFEDFDIADGNVWLYAADAVPASWVGPYQGRGLQATGDFWSDFVFSDAVVIEYLPGSAASAQEVVPFRIREISHLWQHLDSGLYPAGSRLAKNASRAEPPTSEQAAPCSVDVTCFPQWADTARSVARIVFEQPEGTFLCSGTLLNDVGDDNALYFLTAAHCVSDEDTARSVVAFWSYQTSTCNGTPPSANSVPRTAGSTLLTTKGGEGAGDAKGDFTLLLLDDAPGNALLSGWTTQRVAGGTAVTGIHHPKGDFKRITVGETANTENFGNLFLTAIELEGRTQGGSSGSGIFVEPAVLVGDLSFGPKPLPGQTECDIQPGRGVYQRFSDSFVDIQPFLGGDAPPPPPVGEPGGDISLGGSAQFSIDPVDTPTLFTGDLAYRLEVPAGISRVTIDLQTTSPANADLDLFVSFNEIPRVSGDGVDADYSSTGDTGTERIVIDSSSTPPLQVGVYFIAIAAFTTNTQIQGRLTVSFEREAPPPTPTGTQLVSGSAVNFALPPVDSPTLFGGTGAYRVQVPEGATRLDIELLTTDESVDVDLYARFGQSPVSQGGQVLADASSTGFTGNELITLTTADGLRAGTYFIAMALFTEGQTARGTLRATVSVGGGGGGGIPISPASPQNFDLPAVDSPTLFTDVIYRVDVGAQITRLTVDLETTTPDVDVDLYVRFGQPPEISDGRVTANFSSLSATGTEQIVISATSTPPIRAGSYFIGMVLYTTGEAVTGRVRVTLEEASASGPQINAVVHSASFLAGSVAPGEIVSLFGESMGPSTGIRAQLDEQTGRLRTALGGVIVLFDGVPAPLFFVRGDQINVQVPYGVAGRSNSQVVVVFNENVSNVFSMPVAESAPALFLRGNGTSQAVAFNQDGTLNTPQNPAPRGQVVILYGTGEGLTNPAAQDGRLAPGQEPLQRPILPVRVAFGSSQAGLQFAGSAPNFSGLLQINAQIRSNAPTGDAVPVTLTVGIASSPPSATISIR